jgi:hypothetical protein
MSDHGYHLFYRIAQRSAKASEAEALAIVRQLLDADWTAAELVLIFDDSALADEDLPPGMSGKELARRAEAAASNPTRRTA